MASPRKRQTATGNLRLIRLAERPQLDFEIEFYEAILKRNPEQTEALAALAANLRKKQRYKESLRLEEQRRQLRPHDPRCLVDTARCFARLGQPEWAMKLLEEAAQKRYRGLAQLLREEDFAGLREHPRFAALARPGDSAA